MPGKLIEFESAGVLRSAYLALPATPATAGVLVIQEWWGLVPHIKNVADRFAAAGYAALAPEESKKIFALFVTSTPDKPPDIQPQFCF